MKKLILHILLISLSFSLFSQEIQIKGRVTSSDEGEPLPGVSISIKGTTQGTVTDYEGNYSLRADKNSILVFSYVGYIAEEINVNSRSAIDVVMVPDILSLSEIVVVGYGTKKKRDVIGSVASVKSKELTEVPSVSFENALQGRASGVHVSSGSGVPGSPVTIKIRGINSISINTDPLWIIDGMPVYSGSDLARSVNRTEKQSPLSMINPSDIESVEVLKDAAATAIYGSRGSNGVIIVTTKSGKGSTAGFNVDLKGGITDLSRTAENIGFANTSEWFSLVEKARENSGEIPEFNPTLPMVTFPDQPLYTLDRYEALKINTDWFDEIFRKGSYQEMNVSNTAAFDKGSYYLSVNYRNDESILNGNQFQRLSSRANMDINPVDNLKLGTRLNFSYSKNDRVKNGDGSNGAGFGNANLYSLPYYPIYNDSHETGYWNPMSSKNLTALIDKNYISDIVKQYRGLGGLFAEYHIPLVKGLSVRAEGAFDIIQNNSIYWIDDALREKGSYAFDQAVTHRGINYMLYTTYARTFGKHDFNVVIGTESERKSRHTRKLEGQDLIGTYKEVGSPGTKLEMSSKFGNEEMLRAYFFRGSYKFADRYLFEISQRRDGSSKFTEDYRWGAFTAYSLGWIISEESFFASIPVINFLKLRGSFGETGNKDIPNDKTFDTYSGKTKDAYGDHTLIPGGTRITNLGVPSLTWETTKSYDAGVDFGIFSNRISGSFAYYYQDVRDLLLKSELPPSVGMGKDKSEIWGNVGDMENWGIEFNITSVNLHFKSAGFKWTTNFNITTNQNEVKRLTELMDKDGRGVEKDNTISKTGYPLKSWYIPEYAGVDPERGVPLIHEIDRDLYDTTGLTVKTGRLIPATKTNLELNKIIHETKTTTPTYYGGFSNSFQYKGFDLNIHFTFSGGHYIYDYMDQRNTHVEQGENPLRKDLIDNTWEKPGDQAKHPQLVWNQRYPYDWDPDVENPDSPTGKGDWKEGTGNYNNLTLFYSKYLYKGDYIRLNNVQLGYTFSDMLINKFRLKGMRIYFTATNLWTYVFDDQFNGWDPETINNGYSSVPPLRIYSLGLNVNF